MAPQIGRRLLEAAREYAAITRRLGVAPDEALRRVVEALRPPS